MVVFWPPYRLLRGRAQKLWLVAGSLCFYGWFEWRYVGLLLASAGVDFVAGRMIERSGALGRRLWLALSVVTNLGVLFAYKYSAWFFTEINALLPHLGVDGAYSVPNVLLPVGLSFYTFQSMSTTIDVYRGERPAAQSWLDYLGFIAFFPQLVAGPIERSGALLPQLEAGPQPTALRSHSGAWLVLFGFWKKLYVADNLGAIVAPVFDAKEASADFGLVLLAMWAFSLQIYCDFSGYTDIARGVARLLGFELSLNFNQPFFATSPRDLWRRWHISLSQWLRDYLYIPLGGSRHGKLRTAWALGMTMLLGGLWHGASYTFVVWGAYHGLALILDRAIRGERASEPQSWWGQALAAALMFQVTAYGFLWFRANSAGSAWALSQTLLSPLFGAAVAPSEAAMVAFSQIAVIAGPLVVFELVMRRFGLEPWLRLPALLQAPLAAVLFLSSVVLGASFGRAFIYFQF